MGFVRTRLEIADPTRAKLLNLDFLADTGSWYTVIPPRVADELGVKPVTRTRVLTADKREIEADIVVVVVRGLGREAPVFAATIESPEPMIGVEALEALGLAVDPTSGELKPTRPYGLLL